MVLWQKFDVVNFKILIGGALDMWQKTELALYFEDSKNDFLRKATDINPLSLHQN